MSPRASALINSSDDDEEEMQGEFILDTEAAWGDDAGVSHFKKDTPLLCTLCSCWVWCVVLMGKMQIVPLLSPTAIHVWHADTANDTIA